MPKIEKSFDFIDDVISGKKVPLIGPEENRQTTARILITKKGYAKADIKRDVPIKILSDTESYRSKVDLVVSVGGKSVMVIKCVAGSLGSRERETLAAARLLESRPIPLSIVSDGRTALVFDTKSGQIVGKGWEAVPTRKDAMENQATIVLPELPQKRREKEELIFRCYDSMNVNVS
jgi:hypothetical protein